MPLSNPKEMTVRASIGLGSKKRSRCATYSVKKVTIRCQLVSVVAALHPIRQKLEVQCKHENNSNRQKLKF